MFLLFRWFVSAGSVLVAAYLVPGIHVSSGWSALVAACVIGLMNALARPILILLTLPVNLLTLGFFTLVINAFLFWFASTIVKGFDVANFTAAFLGALVYWLVSWLVNGLGGARS